MLRSKRRLSSTLLLFKPTLLLIASRSWVRCHSCALVRCLDQNPFPSSRLSKKETPRLSLCNPFKLSSACTWVINCVTVYCHCLAADSCTWHGKADTRSNACPSKSSSADRTSLVPSPSQHSLQIWSRYAVCARASAVTEAVE